MTWRTPREPVCSRWFTATEPILAKHFRLRLARQARDAFTLGPLTVVGPTHDELDGLAFLERDDLGPEAVAVLFQVDALEEVDRTHAEGGTEEGRRLFESGLPALWRVPAGAVDAFRRSEAPRAERAAAFAERLGRRSLHPGNRLAVSAAFEERFGPWSADASPDQESEVVAAFATLLGGAAPGDALFGFVEAL